VCMTLKSVCIHSLLLMKKAVAVKFLASEMFKQNARSESLVWNYNTLLCLSPALPLPPHTHIHRVSLSASSNNIFTSQKYFEHCIEHCITCARKEQNPLFGHCSSPPPNTQKKTFPTDDVTGLSSGSVCWENLFTLPYPRKLQNCNILEHGVKLISVGNNYLNRLIYLTHIVYKTILSEVIWYISLVRHCVNILHTKQI
jgi:hypothetical protein